MEPTTPLSAGDPSPTPTDAIFGFPDACRPVEFPPSGPAGVESSVPWRVVDWDQPDLSFAKAFITARFRQWRLYIPHLELVPCGDRLMPALFLRVGRSEHPDWSTSVEPTQWGWQWLRTRDNPYVVLQLAVWFENTMRARSANPFRTFVHPAARMEALIVRAGFALVSRRRTMTWSADVFMKDGVPPK